MGDSNSEKGGDKSKQRGFKCACGKAYLSNAALFTHVKIKHGGKEPEGVEKPKQLYHKRGRPSLTMIKQKQIELQQHKPATGHSVPQQKISITNTSKQKFRQLFQFLKEIDKNQIVQQDMFKKVPAFKQLQNHMKRTSNQRPKNFPFSGVNMGLGIAEFLGEVSLSLSSDQITRFQQLVALFMFFLQYVIDENDKKQIVQEAPLQFLVPYINPFITNQLRNIIQDFNIQDLWIMQRSNTIKVLFCFYHWLIMKGYTDYRISMDQQYQQNVDDFFF